MSGRHSTRLPSLLYAYVCGEDNEVVGRSLEVETTKAEALNLAQEVFSEGWNGRIGVYKLVKVIREP